MATPGRPSIGTPQLIALELGWQRRLLAALLAASARGEPICSRPIDQCRARIHALAQAAGSLGVVVTQQR